VGVTQQRVTDQLQAIDQAEQQLAGASSVEEHRQILNRLHSLTAGINAAGGGGNKQIEQKKKFVKNAKGEWVEQ
jgi:cell division protein FtsX